jgi:hypothetical protein
LVAPYFTVVALPLLLGGLLTGELVLPVVVTVLFSAWVRLYRTLVVPSPGAGSPARTLGQLAVPARTRLPKRRPPGLLANLAMLSLLPPVFLILDPWYQFLEWPVAVLTVLVAAFVHWSTSPREDA